MTSTPNPPSSPDQLPIRDEAHLSEALKALAEAGGAHSSRVKLRAMVTASLDLSVDKQLTQWRSAVSALPLLSSGEVDLIGGLTLTGRWEEPLETEAVARLMDLHPWRKGPFTLGRIHLDTEWRSDWKWARIVPHITPLVGRRVLDVGCGNGYHCWRMLGEGARLVIGVDPTRVFHYQFQAISKLIRGFDASSDSSLRSTPSTALPIYHLPLTLEALVEAGHTSVFDTVFSMGVLYHRRAPLTHLRDLRAQLGPQGGELILETLIVDGESPLVPEGRYARMRNVWSLPDRETLCAWIRDAGFEHPRVVDVTPTTIEEQRTTPWMTFHSLREALDPQDSTRTIEGYPAPLRATVVAHAPSP